MSKPKDDVGYCVHVSMDAVRVLKMKTSSFEVDGFALDWIKTLLDIEADKRDSWSVYIEGVYKQFSDGAIDIFVDADGVDKGYQALATTNKGIPLVGNVVVLGNDAGETVLLTEFQAQIAISELGFYKDYGGVGLVDTTGEREYPTSEDHPEALKIILNLLIDYCVGEDVQILTRAGKVGDRHEDQALIMCLHGDSEFIHDCHQVLRDFIAGHEKLINYHKGVL